jgi:hypothetical protein
MATRDVTGSEGYLSREVADYRLLLWPFDEGTKMKISAVISKNLPEATPETHENSVVYKAPNICIAFVGVKIPYHQRETTLIYISKDANWQNEDQERTNIKTLLEKLMDDIMTSPKCGNVI